MRSAGSPFERLAEARRAKPGAITAAPTAAPSVPANRRRVIEGSVMGGSFPFGADGA